ncbi:MAG: AEC family transporter [Lachnospiraceae bacterium]|nr:AEC family transporter [Lachnospiraceae bacterium]
MDYYSIIIPKLFNLVLLILTGVFAVRIGVLKKEGLTVLSGLLMKIILPLLSFHLLMEQKVTFGDLIKLRGMVAAQLCIYPVMILAGLICVKVTGMKYPQRNVHLGCMVSGNYAYVVLPLLYALFEGTQASIYIPLGCSLEALVIWTVGISLFTQGQKKNLAESIRNALNPITYAVLLGFLVNTFSVPIPAIVKETIGQLGSTSTVLGMIYIGASLCFMEKGSARNLPHALIYSVTRMILVPVLVYAAARQIFPEAESIVLMVTACSPSTTIAVMISRDHGLDPDYAAQIVTVSTLFCVISIPVIFLAVRWMAGA